MASKNIKILGIETSCDDTAMALLEMNSEFKILSNIISSQVKIHAKYGGVYPVLAKREHQKNLPLVFKKAIQGKDFDFIGVTAGPGLEPCLWQGINFAKDLAKKFKKPIIPINHTEAHILANWLPSVSAHEPQTPKVKSQKIFPAICLVVSGGHTQIILMNSVGKYKLIGETRDDAAGECFDKTARILGLGYPGGPAVDAEAAKHRAFLTVNRKRPNYQIKLPRPMIYQKNYDFSFSGLKTAVLYDFRSRSLKIRKSKKYIQEISAEVQQAIIDVLIKKTLKAAKNYKAKAIVLSGGVAASEELRKQFKVQSLSSGIKFLVPPKIFCTDNAAMVALTAFYCRREKVKEIKANGLLSI